MKKIIILSIFLLLLPVLSNGEEYALKLRTSYNPGYLRIVLEGAEDIISKAIVNQKTQNIVVTFPDTQFTIEGEKSAVPYKKTDNNTVVLSPGDFRGLKVLSLKNPGRLVIDVYQEERKDVPSGTTQQTEKKKTGPSSGTRLVLDPGHGGFENGIMKDEYAEKNIVLDIAKKLSVLSEQGSFRTSLTRSSDLYMAQGERVKYTNSKDADIFLTLHTGNHREIVIYIPVVTGQTSDEVKPYLYNRGQEKYMKNTVSLLNAMKEALTSDFGGDMVKVIPLPNSILSKIEAAALMIELPSFEYTSYTEEFNARAANALYKGLYLYEENEAK